MAEIELRPAQLDDVSGIHEAFWDAFIDMYRRHGRPVPPLPAEVSPIWTHLVQHHGGAGFWVVESAGTIVAFANGIRREGSWHLSNFWCRPAWQGQGLGRRLARCLRETMMQAGVASVYSSYDPPAMVAYLRLGMLPGAPFFSFGPGPGQRMPAPPAWNGEVHEVTALDAPVLDALGTLDRLARGCRRDVDHQYWAGLPNGRLRLYSRSGVPAAYAWVHGSGRVGPLACAAVSDVPPVLHTAFMLGLELGGDLAAVCVPGANTAAVAWCVEHGLRMAGHTLFFSRPLLGRFDRYVISWPSLL